MALFEIKNNIEPAYLKKLVQWGNKNSNMNNEHQKWKMIITNVHRHFHFGPCIPLQLLRYNSIVWSQVF